jgi:hypothetical protein
LWPSSAWSPHYPGRRVADPPESIERNLALDLHRTYWQVLREVLPLMRRPPTKGSTTGRRAA